MNVLSLFDGISCGRVALDRANINVGNYIAYEIDTIAIKCSKYNYSDIVQKGDVTKAFFNKYKGFDLLMGGSPCQDLCSMGSKKGLQGSKSSLFYEYLRALYTIKPKYFLLENNASMSIENRRAITKMLGIEPIMIDSKFFSAQTRKRLYWTNINVDIDNIVDKKIFLKDIIDVNNLNREDVTDKVNRYLFSDEYAGRKIQKNVKNAIVELTGKSRTIGCSAYSIGSNTSIILHLSNRYYKLTQVEYERLQTLPDGYTSILPLNKAVNCIGNAWTVDVIAHILKGVI